LKLEEFLSRERDRGDSYRLLSQCYDLPADNIAGIVSEMAESTSGICPEATKYFPKMEEEIENLESLRVDYSKLFLGPFALLAPPYGSVYLEGERKVMGDSTIDARNRYREVGLDIAGDFKEVPDHILVELEYMYYLILKEIESIENSDLHKATDYLKKQKGFLEDHLVVWVPEFADKIEENAETEFYKNLAKATKAFVKIENRNILENLASLSQIRAG
jgi:TorA maturation chaperone TorD